MSLGEQLRVILDKVLRVTLQPHDDFLLHTDAARDLYHNFAKHEPIYDYHCHLSQQQILENKSFADLAEIWLGGAN